MTDENPKRDGNPNTNLEKDPNDRICSGDPMTQLSYLKTLSEEAHHQAFPRNPVKTEKADQRANRV